MAKITTFLTFQSGAEEAADFYVAIFDDAAIQRRTVGPDGSVLTVEFTLEGREYVALNGGDHFRFTDGISLAVICDGQDEVDYYSDRLTAGGGTLGPCGWLTDRYGVSWQVNPSRLIEMLADPDSQRAGRVMQSMLQMTKIDIAALERAYADE